MKHRSMMAACALAALSFSGCAERAVVEWQAKAPIETVAAVEMASDSFDPRALTELVKSLPTSPIPLYGHFNPNSGVFDWALAVETARVCNAAACVLRSEQSVDIAVALHKATGCKVGALILHGKEWTGWDWAAADALRQRCIAMQDRGLKPDMVCLHYEGSLREDWEYNLIYRAVKDVWPEALVNWYDCPGWHASWSGWGDKGAVSKGATRDGNSFNFYSDTAATSMRSLVENRRDGLPLIPWISLAGTYGDLPAPTRWGFRTAQPPSDACLANLGELIRYRIDEFAGAILYPGHADHRTDQLLWYSKLGVLVRALNGK